MILDPKEVLLDVGGVHHEKIVVSGKLLVDKKIIHRPPVRVEHHSVQHLTRNHRTDVVGEYVVDKLLRIRAAHEDLTHVRHVEHTHIVADRQMLLGDRRVLDRHVESGERTHFGSESQVTVMQTGNFELLLHNQLSVFSNVHCGLKREPESESSLDVLRRHEGSVGDPAGVPTAGAAAAAKDPRAAFGGSHRIDLRVF